MGLARSTYYDTSGGQPIAEPFPRLETVRLNSTEFSHVAPHTISHIGRSPRSDTPWRTKSRNGWYHQRAANVSYWLNPEVLAVKNNFRSYTSFRHSTQDFRCWM